MRKIKQLGTLYIGQTPAPLVKRKSFVERGRILVKVVDSIGESEW
jgi:hypothetical protein